MTIQRSTEWKEKQRLSQLGKHRSEETKRKMSLSHMGNKNMVGRHLSDETKNKIIFALKGKKQKPFTEEHKKKLSIAHIGLHPSDETRQKMRLNHGDNSGSKNPMYGKHLNEETKHKLSLATTKNNIGNKYALGHHHSKESIEKMRMAETGRKRPPFSEEWRKKLGDVSRGKKRVFTKEWKANMSSARKKSLKVKDHLRRIMKKVSRISKPQKELYFLLKQIFPDATLEYPIQTKTTWRFADIGIPSIKIAFEYDGKHWHEKRVEQDKQRDKELCEVGWATFRINKDSLKILSQQRIFTLGMT